ncbi:unnamed protein product [Staurois parvus]|uniref:Nebulin n=1 Tax=Staurois parvus TaxID=386267 RepID=A0ABN9GZ31_9NEOB|nr:unnamed protein product [Staurois parvus]
MHVKKQSEAVSEIKYREEGERYKSVFNWDMKSSVHEQGYSMEKMKAYEEGKSWFSDIDPDMVHIEQAQKKLNDVQYTEEFEEQTGKGSFPAMITPAYQTARKAAHLASNVEYKRGHEERISQYSSVVDTKDILHAKASGQNMSDVKYTEDYEEQRGKGSFPAMITPGYQIAKKATELASDVKYHQRYHREMKGKASATDVAFTKQTADELSQEYDEEQEEYRGKGSFPAMITPAYLNAKKANEMISDIKYKKDLSKMKGAAHYHTLTTDDNLTLKQAQNVNKLVSEVGYKKDLEHSKGHSINYCETPQFQNVNRLSKYTSDLKYKEKYQTQMKGHYDGVGMDQRMIHAMKAGNLASNLSYKSDKDDITDGEYYYPATLTPSYQTTKKLEPLKDVHYRQSIDKLKYSSVTDTPEIVQAKVNAQQLSDLNYRAEYEKSKMHYTLPQDVPEIKKAKANAELYSENKYKEEWQKTKGQKFEMKMDSLSIASAKASGDLASDIKYKEEYEKSKGKAAATSDSRLLHSMQVGKLSSEISYKKGFEESKAQFHLPMDMVNITHAKKAQSLASELDYRTKLHEYTILPEDMKVTWAKKAYDLQSERQYKSDLTWMKGVGWMTEGSVNVEQAKKAGELVSEKSYRQLPSALKFTSIQDTPEMIQARTSYNQAVDSKYKEQGENIKHRYTSTAELPELLQAKLNALNISETRYKESWGRLRDGGYKLKLDAIPFQAAKASGEIISEYKYKADFEKSKGKMIGLRRLEDDLNLSHSVHTSSLLSEVQYKKGFEESRSQFHLPMDMVNLVHARKAQALASNQDYRHLLHHYTALSDDLRLLTAKRAYELQSENRYRSDLNFMRGVGCIIPGALDIEEKKRASDLISETKYRQQPYQLKYTTITDSVDLLHAKFSNKITNERLYKAAGEDILHHYTTILELPEHVRAKLNAANLSDIKYRESWLNARAQGHKLTMDALQFQTAKSSGKIASDYTYKHEYISEKGKLIGSRSILDDPKMLHCLRVAKLQSERQYKLDSQQLHSQYHLPSDMLDLVHAKRAQALASDQDYKVLLHHYTAEPEDMKLQWARRAHQLQSETRYKSDLNFMRGVGWEAAGSPQIEGAKKAGELISETKYRQSPGSIGFTTVTDSPELLHAKNSYLQCSDRLYKSGDQESLHQYTLPPDHPDFIRARINASLISDKAYRTLWEQSRAAGYDLRLDAIPFQTAKASREIASDFRYKEAFVKERGHQIGFRSITDDPKTQHVMKVSKLQSDREYKKLSEETRSQVHTHLDQPGFIQAKKSQQQASNVNYRQHLHQYTCDPQQLTLKHAKQAHSLQSDVKYKSDLNWMKGVGWTPPGYYKVELARRAAELANAQDGEAPFSSEVHDERDSQSPQQSGVNLDASEILHVKRRKAVPIRK